MDKKISRRTFLKEAAMGAAGLTLLGSTGNAAAEMAVGNPMGSANTPPSNGRTDTEGVQVYQEDAGIAVADSDCEEADLDIADENGNVIARFANGGIRTRNFDSAKLRQDPVEHFESEQMTYTSGESLILSVKADFKKGDEIYFHLEDDQPQDAFGRYASYYEEKRLLASNQRGSNGYFRHIITADSSTVSIAINSTQYETGQPLKLHVYRIVGEVRPKIVTVKADGTGMFKTLKEATESITDANSYINPYVIEVYPGTYDTLSGYTTEQIASADLKGGTFIQTDFVGVKLTDGMSLRGVGAREDIILMAELDPAVWPNAVRGQISTLNIQGSGAIENVTIIGKNLRYCVHDDFFVPTNSVNWRILRNLIFKGENLSYAPQFTTYGAGMGMPRDYLIENCDFGYTLGIHSSINFHRGCTIIVNHCAGCKFRLGDYAGAEDEAVIQVIMNGCSFAEVEISRRNDELSPHMIVRGTGNEDVIMKGDGSDFFQLGMIEKTVAGFAVGTLVARKPGSLSFQATDNRAIACGVVVKTDSEYSYVQKHGYIAASLLGLTGLTMGDYVTVNASNAVVSGGTASDAVGVVKHVDEGGNAHIKLLI